MPRRRKHTYNLARAFEEIGRFRLRSAAHSAVSHAIKSGRMSRQPCVKCGAAWAHAHHEDHTKPLEVVWLCPAHHGARHAAINRGISLADFLAGVEIGAAKSDAA